MQKVTVRRNSNIIRSIVASPIAAYKEQGKQSFQTALTEIEELKQTLRYLEISLVKAKQETEQVQAQLSQQITKTEVRSFDYTIESRKRFVPCEAC